MTVFLLLLLFSKKEKCLWPSGEQQTFDCLNPERYLRLYYCICSIFLWYPNRNIHFFEKCPHAVPNDAFATWFRQLNPLEGRSAQLYIKCFHLIPFLSFQLNFFFWLLLLDNSNKVLLVHSLYLPGSFIIHQKSIFNWIFFIKMFPRSSRAIYFNNHVTAIAAWLLHMTKSICLSCCALSDMNWAMNNEFQFVNRVTVGHPSRWCWSLGDEIRSQERS